MLRRALIFLAFFVGCAGENPCVPLAEQACLMAKEKAKGQKGDPEGAQRACEAALSAAKAADEEMQSRCLEDVSVYRKSPNATKTTPPAQTNESAP